jgi:hypothetical protein
VDNSDLEKLEDLLRDKSFEGDPSELLEQSFFVCLPSRPPLGPVKLADMETFLDEHHLPVETKVQDAKERSEWVLLYATTPFQRRAPDGYDSIHVEESQEVFLHINGQKKGPFRFSEIKENVEDHKIAMTDLISLDNGMTWNRLYQVEVLDRRKANSEKLPDNPQGKVFDHSDEEVIEELEHRSSTSGAVEDLAGLAFMEKVKKEEKKIIPPIPEEPALTKAPAYETGPYSQQKARGLKSKKTMIAVAVSIVILAVAAFTGQMYLPKDLKYKQAKKIKNNYKKVKRKAPKITRPKNAKANNRRNRRPAAVKNRERPRRRTPSFKDSNAYKSRKTDNDRQNEEEDNYYDDEDGEELEPIEQDPVGSRISKETFDPDRIYGENPSDDDLDDGRRPAADADAEDNDAWPSEDQIREALEDFEDIEDY